MRLIRVLLAVLLVSLVTAAAVRAAETQGFVFTTDYSTGSLSAVDLDTRVVTPDVAPGICSDARLRWYGGLLYVVNRFGCDNILVLDPAHGFAFVRQFSTGNGSNPSDIVFVSPTKAYVPRYDMADLLIVNPATGASLGVIAFTPFNDDDGYPEMDHAIRVGDRVFVSVQRLDRNAGFQPVRDAMVAVIDATADTLVDVNPGTPGVQGIVLAARNPVTAFALDPASGRLLVGCVNTYGALDGGIEWVNPQTLASDGLAITEAALGGNVSDVAWNGAAHSYAIVSDLSFNAKLVAWSAVSGTTLGTLYSPGGFSLGDAEIDDRGELYLCRNDFTLPGLVVFSTATDAMLAGPLPTGLPPNQITFDQASNVASVPAPAGAASVRFAPPAPNPARREMRFAFTLEQPASMRLDVFDVAGRSVRTIVRRSWNAGRNEAMWDLRDASGTRVRQGIYLVRATFDRGLVRKSDTTLFIGRVAVLD